MRIFPTLPVGRLVRRIAIRATLALFASTFAATSEGRAQGGLGDITVTPTRIVLEGRERSGTISLANTGGAKATYRLTVVNMRMDQNGAFEEIPDGAERPGELFAETLFRFAPRQVSLEPGETQVIRVAARKPAGLAAGEYRSHLVIRAIPQPDAASSIERKSSGSGLEVSLAVIPGIALPVIVRHGEVSSDASLSDLRYEPPAPAGDRKSGNLSFRLNRSGNGSVYGDLSASYFPPGGDAEILVSEVNQLAVYTPNAYRLVKMPLFLPEGTEVAQGGKFVVLYRLPPKDGGEIIAAAEYIIE